MTADSDDDWDECLVRISQQLSSEWSIIPRLHPDSERERASSGEDDMPLFARLKAVVRRSAQVEMGFIVSYVCGCVPPAPDYVVVPPQRG